MITGEIAQLIGIAKQDKSIEQMPKRNTPTYLENAISTLIYYNEEQFQYKKDIQVEASIKGHITLRDSPHVKKYKEIMDIVEYGDNPEIHITNEQRAQKDNFDFTGSRIKKVCAFQISTKTKHELEGLSQRIDIDINDLDFMAYTIGYQDMLSNIPAEQLNNSNKELLRTLTNECIRIDKFLERRTLHKIIDYCPLEIDYINKNMTWSL